MHRYFPLPLLLLALTLAACQPAVTAPTAASTLPAPSRTPVPPTLTHTPEPTVTPTPPPPTPLPRYFTEEFDGAAPAWSMLQSNGGELPAVSLQDGALTLELRQPNQWAYAILGAEEYADARLEASVRSRGSAPEAFGLICRYSEAEGWYEFNISSDGSYNVLVGRWLAEGVASYTPVASAATEYVLPGGQANEIGLLCQEDILWLYVNGKLFRKLDVAHIGLREGRMGLAAASFENVPVTASFEWVKVSEP